MLRPPLICSVWEGFYEGSQRCEGWGKQREGQVAKKWCTSGQGTIGGRVLVQGPTTIVVTNHLRAPAVVCKLPILFPF